MDNDGYGSDPDVDRSYGPAPYGDGYICPCLWHQEMIERLEDYRLMCHSWPGPTCGTCWRATCACGYTFEDPADARGAARPHGRLYCHSPACPRDPRLKDHE